MPRKILIFVFSVTAVALIAQLPIFPLISEMREITQDGESLLQEWTFVSLSAFYDSARFAQSGWLESTWNNYLILAFVNHLGLILAFFGVRSLLSRIFLKERR
ncbi:MAG: hypothetical protein HXY38_08805 [Chloroflexi bacterium]|nr:hypothetical protein [Chloroflexota bacterium]